VAVIDLQRVALFVVKGEKREMAGQEKPYKKGRIQRGIARGKLKACRAELQKFRLI
jgi:hypothetical protein